MNLVEVATWIQEGYKMYYNDKKNGIRVQKSDFIMRHVMHKGKGHLNPKIIQILIDVEDSVEDENGMAQI